MIPRRSFAVRHGIFILLLALLVWVQACPAADTGIFWPASRLEFLRQSTNQPAFAEAFQKLRDDAKRAARTRVLTVTRKAKPAPSGDIHDYLSLGPYWWPDTTKSNGLPYVRRDGVVNPETRGPDTDAGQLRDLASSVPTLALSWSIFRNEAHARHAGKLLRAWFLDPATRMNPNLNYAQGVPGHNTGRGAGIIDGVHFVPIPDAVLQLRGAPGWSAADEQGMRAWFAQYLDWLRTSPNGVVERKAANNHGTWYDVQCAISARFAGKAAVEKDVLEGVASKRIATQIEPDGRQPHELARTHAWTYSLMNLDAFLLLATLSAEGGPDLWHYTSRDGRSIRGAVGYLAGFADPAVAWPYQEISKIDRNGVLPLVLRARSVYGAGAFKTVPPQPPKARSGRAWLQVGTP